MIFSREIEPLNLKELLNEEIKEEMEFTKEAAIKSGVNLDEKELYAVGNMIKVRKLERELEEKDKEIDRLKAQLKTK
ncbi:hypothetical protein LCGC14_2108940 [marine sediment metagenome]|uniref:Uncharacterized protein n=1 Tax=marine sediment metagenome TaxID=412755 RepID=A0A0F9EUS8_9ZZZZ